VRSLDEIVFELGQRTENIKNEFPAGRDRVDRLGQALFMVQFVQVRPQDCEPNQNGVERDALVSSAAEV
jgi:hypothetical protein